MFTSKEWPYVPPPVTSFVSTICRATNLHTHSSRPCRYADEKHGAVLAAIEPDAWIGQHGPRGSSPSEPTRYRRLPARQLSQIAISLRNELKSPVRALIDVWLPIPRPLCVSEIFDSPDQVRQGLSTTSRTETYRHSKGSGISLSCHFPDSAAKANSICPL